ncbi:putative peptidoglycan binding protein [Micromonospora violae]|uniref:Putative peptidoglycan binding protein n=1 Tax=Micromonospora violae TaxID=1278207 RepID=A0A4Q7UC93_9ACTN|nr:helix-turn-helix domain-containing protein [Micromonospora violae]RZT77631.1 putative peptidoglycan binding protein [Micromonospora violae]
MDDAARNPVPQPTTAGEYVASLREVRRQSGLTYRELARRASAAGHWLPPSTLATMLGRTTLPRERTVVALLAACGTPAVEVDRLLETRRDLEGRIAERGRGEHDAARTPADPSTTVPANIRPSVGPVPPRPGPPGPTRRWLRLALLTVFGVLTVGASGALRPLATPAVDSSPTDGCPAVLRQGMYGPCVLNLQEHLVADGLTVPVDGWFGLDTTGRVMVFQAFGGLPVSGVADERLFDELAGDRKVPAAWSEDRIGKHLRRTFPEDPAGAVQVARCLSGLDPYRVEVGEDGSRWWGLFQFSDVEVSRFGVDHRTALDPGWNIRAAREIWSRTGDFGHWNCARA